MNRISMAGMSLVLSLSVAQAQGPGSLDPTFGTGGIVSTSGTGVAPYAAIQQSSGDIVVFGTGPSSNSIGLLRYTPSGQLDTTFGANGITVTDISAYATSQVSIAVQPNDDILVLKELLSFDVETNILLVRYTPDGALDTTFGDSGIVQTPGAGASALLLQPNGQIVVGGGGPSADDGTLPTTLVRYNSDGSLDPSFGTGGIAKVHSGLLQPAALALLSNGDYLSVEMELSENQKKGSVLEFNSSGVRQSRLTKATPTATSANPNAGALALFQSNGKYVVVATVSQNGSSLVEATRFAENAEVDSTFSSTPFTFNPLGNESEPFAAAFQSNGQLVVGGQLLNAESELFDYALARLDSNGKLDTDFGSGGTVTGSESGISFVTGLLIQKNGEIVALSSSGIARFLAN